MTLPQRIAVILKRSFAYLHPCLLGPVGGGEAYDLGAIASALRKEIEYLLPDSDPGQVVDAFLERLPEVRRILETDAQAAYEGDPAATSRMEVVMAYPGMYAVTVHRLAHELYPCGKREVFRVRAVAGKIRKESRRIGRICPHPRGTAGYTPH